jgi:hypothetical protein
VKTSNLTRLYSASDKIISECGAVGGMKTDRVN